MRLERWRRILALWLALGLMAEPLLAQPQSPASSLPADVITSEGVLLRLDQVDLTSVADLYGRITDRIIIPSPELKGKLSILNRSRVPKAQAARLIESALELQGWTVIPEGNVAKLVKSKDAVKRMVPTVSATSESELSGISRVQTHLVQIRHAKGEDVKAMISPLLSNEGTIQFNERTNLLVVTEVGTNMARLMELIERVDRPLTTREESVRSVELKYVAPRKMVDTIKDYFKSSTLRFLPDERLQVLVLTGKQDEVDRAVALVAELDRPVPRDQTLNQILRVQYAKATDVAQLVEKLYKGRADAPPPTFSINADKDSNSIILTGPPELREEIAGLISRIDVRYQQVLLKVLIGELSSGPKTTLGVQWARALGSVREELAQDLGAMGLSAQRTSVRTSTPGLRYSLLRPHAWSFFVQALETNTDFNTLASPQITVSNNKPAMFVVGRRVPVQTSERISDNSNTVVRSNEFVDVGLTLKATPQITPLGEVSLDVELKFSEQIGTNADFKNPIFSNRETKTNVIVQDEHTLVIGGLMRHDRNESSSAVPVLGKLPVVGALFRQTTVERPRSELIVMLTPSIMDKSPQADVVTQVYKDTCFSDGASRSFQKDWHKTTEYLESLSKKGAAAAARTASTTESAPPAACSTLTVKASTPACPPAAKGRVDPCAAGVVPKPTVQTRAQTLLEELRVKRVRESATEPGRRAARPPATGQQRAGGSSGGKGAPSCDSGAAVVPVAAAVPLPPVAASPATACLTSPPAAWLDLR